MKNTWFLCCLLPIGVSAQRPDSIRANPAKTTTAPTPYQMSQQERQQAVDMAAQPDAMFRNVRTFDGRYEGLRGTPYFLPIWAKGQIELTNGQRYTNVLIKFDAYQQELVLLRPQARNDSIIIDRPRVSRFVLQPADNVSYVFRRYSPNRSSESESGGYYFLVLYEGKNVLLKQVAKVVRKASYKDPYSADIRYDMYENDYAYYLLKPDQTLTKVKLSKKSLLDALDNRSDALKIFAGKLGFKSEADAIALVQQYDSL